MKTPDEIINEKLVIQEGYFKGAKVTLSIKTIIELMIEYHKQFEDGKTDS